MNQPCKHLLIVSLLVIMGCQHAGDTNQDTMPAGMNSRDNGGPVVDGLQVCLSAEKRVWRQDDGPEIKSDVLVVGEGELGFLDPPMGACLEFDGTKYWPVGAGAMSIPHPPLRTSIYGMAGTLRGDNYGDTKGQPFVLTPGKHTIRVIFSALPPEGSAATPRLVYSNPLEIVISEDRDSR
ncbi:MAG: hypothetical protein HQ515_18040 [Phycisphaeraceae bacterium]|nr:hypothetical protein [Phycisphaeraceae bacterium]